MAQAYIYGNFGFGDTRRSIIAYPQCDRFEVKGLNNSQYFNSGGDIEDVKVPQVLVPISYRTCLLSAEKDALVLKESLTSSSFVLELHTDDLCSRVFSTKHLTDYNKICAPTPPGSPRQATRDTPPEVAAVASAGNLMSI